MAEPTTQKNNIHLVYGVAFTVIALVALIALVFYKSRADTSTENVVVSNQAPAIGTVSTHGTACRAGSFSCLGGSDISSFTLTEDTTTDLYWDFQITDNNGCTEVSITSGNVTSSVARTNAQSSGACAADNNTCYAVTESACHSGTGAGLGSCTGAGDTTVVNECSASIQYYADPTDAGSPNSTTDWTISVSATDSGSAASNTATDTLEFASTTALVLEQSNADGATALTSMAHGSIALGSTGSGIGVLMAIVNSGNRSHHPTFLGSGHGSASGLRCNGVGSSNIDVGFVRYNTTSGQNHASGTSLTTSAVTQSTAIANRTSESVESKDDYYWTLILPATSVSGTCDNTVNVQTSVTGT